MKEIITLKQLRELESLTMRELADLMGTTAQSVEVTERKFRWINLRTLHSFVSSCGYELIVTASNSDTGDEYEIKLPIDLE